MTSTLRPREQDLPKCSESGRNSQPWIDLLSETRQQNWVDHQFGLPLDPAGRSDPDFGTLRDNFHRDEL